MFDIQALLKNLGPILAATNPAAAEGYRRHVEKRQKADALAVNQQNVQADNDRADLQLEMQAKRDALARISDYRGTLTDRASQLAETAEDPVAANLGFAKEATGLANVYGVDPSVATGLAPNLNQAVSSRKKKKAQELYAQAEKQYGQEAMVGDAITLQTPEFGPVKPSQLRALFGVPATGPQGEPAAPAVKPQSEGASDLDRSYQRAKRAREAELGRPLTPAEENALDKSIRSEVRAINAPASKKPGLTPNASLGATLKLRDRFTKETQAAQAVNTQLRLMKSSLEAVKKGAEAPGSQGVLVTFQKILDPTSVVRESEYARSASGLSLLSRMQGAYEQIVKGGAGVPIADLEQFVLLAEQFVRNQATAANTTKQQIDAIASEYGLNPGNITRDLGLPDPEGDAGGGGGPVDFIYDPKTKTLKKPGAKK